MGLIDKVKGVFMVAEDDELEEEVVAGESLSEEDKIEIKYRGITAYKQAKEVCECLRKNYPVVINLQTTSPEIVGRVTDYLSGVLEAIDGEIVAIGINMWICTPHNVIVDGRFAEHVRQEVEDNNQQKKFSNRPNQNNSYNNAEVSPFGNKR